MASLGEQCTAAIKAAAGDELNEDQIRELVKKVTNRAAEYKRAQKIMHDPDAILQAVKDIKDEERIARKIELRSRAVNVLRKKERFAFYEGLKGDEANALQSMTVGVEGSKFGYANSTEALIHAERSRAVTGLSLDLERSGLDKRIEGMSRDDNLDLARELRRATGGNEAPTGNKTATDLAGIYSKWLEVTRGRLNAAGAWIREMEGFIVRQSHDQLKVRGDGTDKAFQTWRDFIYNRLDERTFDDIGPKLEDRNDYLKSTWSSLSTGVHLKSTESDWLGGFKGGSANLAKRASQERSLHFKDAKSWFEYNEQFGTGNIHQTIAGTMQRASRDVALLKKWGTNPGAAFASDVDQLLKRAKDRNDLSQIDALSGKTMAGRRMLAMLEQIDGTADIAGSPTLARLGRNIRGFETLGKLTGTVLASFGDIPARAASLEWHGQGFFAGMAKSVGAIMKGRGDLEARELLHRIGSASEGVIGDIASRFDAADKFDGRMAKLVKLDMVLNGQKYWTDSLLNQSTKDISTSLGLMKDKGFSELPKDTQISLRRFGVTEDHWDYARANPVTDASGRAHIVSDSIKFEPDDVIRKMIGNAEASAADISRFKDRFEDTWRQYFITSSRESMTEPTATTKYIITGGTRPGTGTGELLRFISQFKSFSAEFVHSHLNRELNRNPDRGLARNIGGVVQLVLATTAMGYLSSVAKDAVLLRTPKSPESVGDYAKVITDAFARGGGLGILGDIITNDWSKQNGGVANLLGPTAGSLGDAFGLAQNALNAAFGVHNPNLLGQTISVVNNHIPFVNLWYSKAAWQFLVLQGLQESANPGYLGRMERRLDRENHQSLMVPTLY